MQVRAFERYIPFIYIPSFLVRFAKARARLRQCAVSPDPLMFVYAILLNSHELAYKE